MRNLLKIMILVIVFANANTISAQSEQNYQDMNLHFVYIDHEVTTPVNTLCKKLRTLQEDASEVGDALIVYLSDGKSSLFSFTNLKDINDKQRDTEQAFVEIIAALQDANSHDVTASIDVANIIELFDEYNFVDSKGNSRFNSVTFDFYIGGSFWALGNNEKVIAHLYEVFSLYTLPKSQFNLNLYKPKGEQLVCKEGQQFGDNNLGSINEKVKVFEY